VFTGKYIVCLAGCEWNFTWQPTQEIMFRLAQAGNYVLYIEPTGTRNVKFSDWRRVIQRMRTIFTGVSPTSSLPKQLEIYTPLILPFPHLSLARLINRWIITRKIKGWIDQKEQAVDILWVYFPSLLNLDLIRASGSHLAVYQIMSSAEAARPHPMIVEANKQLLQNCDFVFANSRSLCNQALEINANSHLFRAGVNLELFDSVSLDANPRPDDLPSVKSPLIGYVGAIHEWVDIDLLTCTAKAMPDCEFVLLGPIMREIHSLKNLSNIHFLGQKAHKWIPLYVQYFDVCLIPYVQDAYTATAYPAKLNEYLALGKPVVATPLPELLEFNREFGEVLHLAGDPESFIQAIRKALVRKTPQFQQRYRDVARKNSWEAKINEMSILLEDCLRVPSLQKKREDD